MLTLSAKRAVSMFLSLSFFVFVVSPALAVENNGKSATRGSSMAQARGLSDVRVKACQEKKENIVGQMESTTRLVNTQFLAFDSILKRVTEFYTVKMVPTGRTVANYNTLLEDIQTQKNKVQAALDQAIATSKNFACSGENPVGILTEFKTSMRAVRTALQEYRSSIRTLITAVRGLGTPRPRASASPAATPTP